MLGTSLQFGGVRGGGGGDDRVYIPVKARKNQNQRKQAQKAKNGEEEIADSALDDNSNPKQCLDSPSTVPSVESVSNIDRFLDSTKLLVPAQYFSKTTMRGWKTCDVEYQSYFALNDLWESFKEWSAYGAGVPLLLDQRESVVQYYVPYLSAIQLYGQPTEKSSAKPRYTSEDSDGDYYRDSCSEGSSDYEYGKKTECLTAQRSSKHLTSGISSQMSTLSIHDRYNTVQEGFSSSDDSEAGNPQELLFQYLEQGHPYSREPLTDKILDLARDYPALMSLRSCDLLPSSWMSVAWYPIYRIPTGPTLKDLDACFLTYHTLHTPLTGSVTTPGLTLVYPSEMDGIPNISIPTFAMAAYKLKGSIWMKKEAGDNQVMHSLLQAADKWLRLVQVTHPDHQFFKSHGTYCK
ncbi:uncharacterized protein LOC127101107 isoform X2 [Lathyrus oleraceus]|uniref:Uncharacterized protein n=1 Tax=Pisum sativum TaxID=3888 RepID=A0A9D4ZWQ3_PEA|nr:uncharacterized protein LOC127101107 isoform X2 [Pisum sativum]KAI5385343.1 hypothetical protein KIW84_072081 [Pisum sativum]